MTIAIRAYCEADTVPSVQMQNILRLLNLHSKLVCSAGIGSGMLMTLLRIKRFKSWMHLVPWPLKWYDLGQTLTSSQSWTGILAHCSRENWCN